MQKNSAWHGKVTFFFEDGKIQFKGETENGMFHGKGTRFKQEGDQTLVDVAGNWDKGEFI